MISSRLLKMDESIFNKEEHLSKIIEELNNSCETNKKDFRHFYEWEMEFIDLVLKWEI